MNSMKKILLASLILFFFLASLIVNHLSETTQSYFLPRFFYLVSLQEILFPFSDFLLQTAYALPADNSESQILQIDESYKLSNAITHLMLTSFLQLYY